MSSPAKESRTANRRQGRNQILPAGGTMAPGLWPLLIIPVTFVVFFPALENGFVDWDDDKNFLENPHYRGLSWTQLRWMFTAFHEGHYQPLSWLTLGADYFLWGMDPFGYHLTNLILHAANAAVFFYVTFHLLRLVLPNVPEGGLRPLQLAAAFAALIFAVHPLRVESVAWVTERRDVLSGLFFLLTILCYLRANSVADSGAARSRWMIATFVVFILCLLSKAIGIILPIVLLVIDVYPLRRLGGGPGRWFGSAARRLWWEKVSFLLVAVAFGVIAIFAQQESQALRPFQRYGFTPRIAQVIFGTAFYLWKTILPYGLSPLYELPEKLKLWDWPIIFSGSTLLAITIGLWALRHRWPAGLANWVYYLVVLAPVSGIAQSGVQIAADRYTYLSCLGWAILAGAGLLYAWRSWISGKIRPRTIFLINAFAVTWLIVLGTMSWRQIGIWRDSETLWRHVLAVDPTASVAHNNLGTILYRQGTLEEAIAHYRRSLQISSNATVQNNLGNALAKQGKAAEAKESYSNALKLKPDFAEAHVNLGNLFGQEGKLEEAVRHFREAVRADVGDANAHHSLAIALAEQGQLPEAIQHFRKAAELSPRTADIYLNWGTALTKRGRLDDAIDLFHKSLAVKPDFVEAYHNLGSVMAARGDLDQAIHYLLKALQIDPAHVNSHFNLANIVARQGDLQWAIKHFQAALKVKPDFAEAHESLARALAAQGKTREAAQHYQEALRILKSRRKAAAG